MISAYFTFVALNEKNRPKKVPFVIPETELEKRRYEEADLRRKNRIAHAENTKKLRNNSPLS